MTKNKKIVNDPFKEAYPGICGQIKWIEDNDAFCKKDDAWDLQLLQARFIMKYYEIIYSTIASPLNVFMDYNQL